MSDIVESAAGALRGAILNLLDELEIEPRALGRSDYPAEFPLREVLVIARHCAGGVILGFEQIRVTAGILKPGTNKELPLRRRTLSIPTPWNQLEAGILFGLDLPLVIFRESEIFGGVFDNGVTDVFVHSMATARPTKSQLAEIKQVFLKWYARVSSKYYGPSPAI